MEDGGKQFPFQLDFADLDRFLGPAKVAERAVRLDENFYSVHFDLDGSPDIGDQKIFPLGHRDGDAEGLGLGLGE